MVSLEVKLGELSTDLFMCLAVSSLSGGMQDLDCITWDLSLWRMGVVVVAHRLTCSVACEVLVSQPEIEPESPELQGEFPTTGPPGKSLEWIFERLFNPRSQCYLVNTAWTLELK